MDMKTVQQIIIEQVSLRALDNPDGKVTWEKLSNIIQFSKLLYIKQAEVHEIQESQLISEALDPNS